MLASGLKTNWVPELLPPHRMPASTTLLDPERLNTGEPLSPPATRTVPFRDTSVWHSCTMLVPDTPTAAQVEDTCPWVQPVVRPTLFRVEPTAKLVLRFSEEIVRVSV